MSKTGMVVFICWLVLMFICGFQSYRLTAKAQETQEAAPYEVASFPGSVKVFKLVHKGCELFIVQGTAYHLSNADSVAIATGRGCK